jgi:hypothetical protein
MHSPRRNQEMKARARLEPLLKSTSTAYGRRLVPKSGNRRSIKLTYTIMKRGCDVGDLSAVRQWLYNDLGTDFSNEFLVPGKKVYDTDAGSKNG